MAVRVTCPNPDCAAAANVEEASLGRRGRCKTCGQVFELARPDGQPASLSSGDASAWKGSDPASPTDLPEQFGRYRIRKKLGQGGMGAVYLAHDTRLDRPVALKVPFFHPLDGPQAIARFEREARAAATLDHPNLCPIYDVGEIGGVAYLTMPYVEGKTLADALTTGQTFTEVQAAAVVRKLAQALQEAHARGVVHRDLKPANIMIKKGRDLVIMDFGLARMAGGEDGGLTRTGHVLGTALYMAPEQAAGDLAAIGPAVDVYALGVILHELLTGQRPFEGPWSLVIGLKNVKDPDPPSRHRPGLSPAIDAVCLKAIAQKPEGRYASMADFADALGAFPAAPAPNAYPPESSHPIGSPDRLGGPAFAGIIAKETVSLLSDPHHAQPGPPRPSSRARLIIAAAAGTALLLGVLPYMATSKGPAKLEARAPDASAKLEEERDAAGGQGGPATSRAEQAKTSVETGGREIEAGKDDVPPGDATPSAEKADPVPTGELVAFYDFDDATAGDRTGHGHHGISGVKPPTFTPDGYQGGAAVIDGKKPSHLQLPVDINPNSMPQITMGGWFNARSADSHGPLISSDNRGFDRALSIDDRPKLGAMRWSAFTGQGVLPGPPIVLGKWAFVAMRHDQATMRLTLDVDGATYVGKAYFGLGARTTFLGKHPPFKPNFDGKIDNIFIFNYRLSDQQIADIRVRGDAAIASIGEGK